MMRLKYVLCIRIKGRKQYREAAMWEHMPTVSQVRRELQEFIDDCDDFFLTQYLV